MSIGVTNYKCVCGGNVTEGWENGDVTLTCDNNCESPYSYDAWKDGETIIQNSSEYAYRGITYYKDSHFYYCEVRKNGNKSIYNSFEDERSVKKWIDESLVK